MSDPLDALPPGSQVTPWHVCRDSLEPIALALERARDEWDAPAPEGESESEYTSRMARIFWRARLAGALASHQWERAVLWMEIQVGVDFAARLAGKVEALVGDVERMVRHALDSPHAAAVRHRREWLRPNANGSLPPEAKRLPPPVNPDESREPNGFEHQDLIDMTVRFAGLAYELRQLSAELHPLAGSPPVAQSDTLLRAPGTAGDQEHAPPGPSPDWQFIRHGRVYEIAGCGEKGLVWEMVGLRQIEKLIRGCGRAIPFSELIAETSPNRPTTAARETADEDLQVDTPSYEPVYDRDALEEFDRRLREIAAELEEAKDFGDTAAQERLENERDGILAAVNDATGVGGKQRSLDRGSEKQRLRIFQAIQRAYEKLREAGLPRLADHLETNISTESGAYKYAPQPAQPWSFDQK